MKIITSMLAAAAFCSLSGGAFAATANAPGARALTVAPKGTTASLLLSYSPQDGGTIYEKNVASVTELTTGVFCVAPTRKLPKGSLPIVTVEWGASSGSNLEAFLEYGTFDCPEGNIEVRTFDTTGGNATPADNIAFDVNVQ